MLLGQKLDFTVKGAKQKLMIISLKKKKKNRGKYSSSGGTN